MLKVGRDSAVDQESGIGRQKNGGEEEMRMTVAQSRGKQSHRRVSKAAFAAASMAVMDTVSGRRRYLVYKDEKLGVLHAHPAVTHV